MNLEYQLTKQGYMDFNIYHMTYSVTFRRSLFIQRFIFPIIFLVLPIFLPKTTYIPLWYWFSICMILAILWIGFYPKILKKSVTRRISKMLDEGKATGIVGKHIFIYVSAIMAYIIPIRIFSSIDEKNNFLNMLKKKWPHE